MSTMEALLLLLRKYQADGSLNVSALARHCGFSRQHMYTILAGKKVPTLPVVEKMAEFLDLEIRIVPKETRRKRSA